VTQRAESLQGEVGPWPSIPLVRHATWTLLIPVSGVSTWVFSVSADNERWVPVKWPADRDREFTEFVMVQRAALVRVAHPVGRHAHGGRAAIRRRTQHRGGRGRHGVQPGKRQEPERARA